MCMVSVFGIHNWIFSLLGKRSANNTRNTTFAYYKVKTGSSGWTNTKGVPSSWCSSAYGQWWNFPRVKPPHSWCNEYWLALKIGIREIAPSQRKNDAEVYRTFEGEQKCCDRNHLFYFCECRWLVVSEQVACPDPPLFIWSFHAWAVAQVSLVISWSQWWIFLVVLAQASLSNPFPTKLQNQLRKS